MDDQKQDVEQPKQKSNCLLIGVVLAVVLLVVVVGGYFGLAWILRTIDKNNVGVATTDTTAIANNNKTSDSAIVGEWKTDCLVPDPNSPWAEQHTFTIKSDGTANHKRLSGDSCNGLAQDNDDNYKYTIPSSGKINLTYVSGNGTMADALNPVGQVIYDIYQVSGDTLYLGHGFRGDNLSYGGKTGVSEAQRFDSPNTFLAYKKQ